MNLLRLALVPVVAGVALSIAPVAAQADVNDTPRPQHNAVALKFGTFDCRAACGDFHASTGGMWVGPRRLTLGGANVDAASHWAGYQP